MKVNKKLITLIILAMAMCLTATGCMGGQKDINKADEKKYEAVVAEACEEYGYEYEKQTVFPLGAELLYALTNGDDSVEIIANIDEESTTDKVECRFEITRTIASEDDRVSGLEQHLGVLVKISEYFTDEITEADVVDFLNNEDIWTESEDENVLMYKEQGSWTYTISQNGEELEEHLDFGWDNGKKYSLKKDK